MAREAAEQRPDPGPLDADHRGERTPLWRDLKGIGFNLRGMVLVVSGSFYGVRAGARDLRACSPQCTTSMLRGWLLVLTPVWIVLLLLVYVLWRRSKPAKDSE